MIKFFISSTFIDMDKERDALHSIVYPKIREYGLEKGVAIDICDLRWGIYIDKNWDEEKATEEIMKVCFGELKNCEPYLISIIGNYYGFVPKEQEVIRKLWKKHGKQNLPPKENLSLTQWELEFAFISGNDVNTQSICMFREENIDGEINENVVKLKEKIKNKEISYSERIECHKYSRLNEFCEIIEKRIKRIIDIQSKGDNDNWIELENKYSFVYSREKIATFGGRKKVLKKCQKNLLTENINLLGFFGESGIGKTSIMAKLYDIFLSKKKKTAILFVGANKRTTEYIKILLYLIYMIEKEMSDSKVEPHDDFYIEEKTEEFLVDVIKKYESSNDTSQYIFFIDNLGNIGISAQRLIGILSNVDLNKIKFVFSSIERMKGKNEGKIRNYLLEGLGRGECEEIIGNNFLNLNQQKGNIKLVNSVLGKNGSSSPFYLNCITTIMKMHVEEIKGDNDRIMEFIEGLPEDLENICWETIKESVKYLKNNTDINEDSVFKIIGFIATSKYGLLEKELEKIINNLNNKIEERDITDSDNCKKWRALDFVYLRLFLKDFFRQQENGRWVFEHDIIKKGVYNYYEYGRHNIIDFQKNLYLYIKFVNNIEIQVREGLYLSFVYQDHEMTFDIIKKLIDERDKLTVRRMAAIEFWGILNGEELGGIWFESLILENKLLIMKFMHLLLEDLEDEDYLRIIPAIKIIEKFFKLHEKTFKFEESELWYLYNLHINYLIGCECIGEEEKAFDKIEVALKYYKDNAKEFTIEKKIIAYRDLNSAFYINNKIMANRLRMGNMEGYYKAKEISETVIISFEDDIFSFHNSEYIEAGESRVRGIYEKYISNIGQFYNGTKEYEKAFKYHSKSLMLKIDSLFNLLSGVDKSIKNNCHDMFNFNNYVDEYSLLDIDWLEHRKNWRKIDNYISRIFNLHIKDNDKLKKKIELKWKTIGVGYRTMGDDCFHLKKEKYRYPEFIDMGCNMINISYEMISNDKYNVPKREEIITLILKIGIYSKKDEILPHELDDILQWLGKAVENYLKNEDFYGKKIKNTLISNIEYLQEKIEDEKKQEYISELLVKTKDRRED